MLEELKEFGYHYVEGSVQSVAVQQLRRILADLLQCAKWALRHGHTQRSCQIKRKRTGTQRRERRPHQTTRPEQTSSECTAQTAYQLRTRLFHVKHMCDYEIIIIKETTGDISCSNTDITTNAAWFSSVLILLLLLLRYLLLHFKVHAELYLVLLRNHLQSMTFQLALLWLSVWDEFKLMSTSRICASFNCQILKPEQLSKWVKCQTGSADLARVVVLWVEQVAELRQQLGPCLQLSFGGNSCDQDAYRRKRSSGQLFTTDKDRNLWPMQKFWIRQYEYKHLHRHSDGFYASFPESNIRTHGD